MGQLSCDPRGMTGVGPTSSRPPGPGDDVPAAGVDPALQRANRLNAANMIRSIVPLVLISVALVWWQSVQQSVDERVQTVDPSSTVQLAAARAGYPLLLPTGLGEDYLVTSARTDAGNAGEGDPVTVEIGYLTPSKEYAGFVVSDDPGADALSAVLTGAEEQGTVDVAGETWTRSTTERDETALSRESGGVTVVVSGSAPDDELEEVAAAVRPYSG
jgi:cytoskeletal protein RodZ